MNDFIEKWKNDKKYRTKIKLIAYTAFVVIVSIYALSINSKMPSNDNSNEYNNFGNFQFNNNTIDIPTAYTYKINVNIDDDIYTYSGNKTNNEDTIKKEHNGIITEYRYFNNEYYILMDDVYQITNKEMVYNPVNYNYINLSSINTYLNKAKKINNEYHVYLKDIILGNESDKYFIISINDNYISIDYTPLVNEFDYNIKKYLVDITYEKNNERG